MEFGDAQGEQPVEAGNEEDALFRQYFGNIDPPKGLQRLHHRSQGEVEGAHDEYDEEFL